jgi:hypothetical protein
MPNPITLGKRVQEIIDDRFWVWYNALQASVQEANAVPQEEQRAAYEQITKAHPAVYPAARAQFEAQNTPEALSRQEQLGLRRQARDEGR